MTGWETKGLEVNAELTRWFASFAELSCYQRVSIASYANRWYSQRGHVRLSQSGIVSKRRKLAARFLHHPRA